MSKWQWILAQFGKRLWVRATFFSLLAVLTALVALLARDYIPPGMSQQVGAQAVDSILKIIANSMLVVTTFSLSTMVAAYSAATTSVTPRATQLLLQDSTAQNALSVFIGAFLYSLVGIIALSMQVYGDDGRLVLFVVTIFVIVLIVVVLLRWISYLSRLGRVRETINMVEKATSKAIINRIKQPYLGGVPLRAYQPGRNHVPVSYDKIGYIQHLDMGALSNVATEMNADFYIRMIPGAFNDGHAPLFYSTVALDDKTVQKCCKTFSIGDSRSFEQDPRFGLIVLSEIASRALSLAVNDPGTAIDIIGTSIRILTPWASHGEAPEPIYKNIHVPPLATIDLFEDIFRGIARDGAAISQVGVRLHKAILSLKEIGNEEAISAAHKVSEYALAYARLKIPLESEIEELESLGRKFSKP